MNTNAKVICTLSAPYPELRVERQNQNYSRLLSAAYAGQDGELVAILMYLYGENVSKGRAPNALSETLACIAKTEMRHLSMLGELIFMLGGDPRYINMTKRMGINTAMLPYQTDPLRIVANAVAAEDKAIKLYESLYRVIDDKYIRAVIKRIIMDEEHHLKIFSEMQSVPVPYRK